MTSPLKRFAELNVMEILLWLIILTMPIANEQGLSTIEAGFTVFPSYLFGLAGIYFLFRDKIKSKNIKFWGSPIDLTLLLFILAITVSIFQSRLIGDISGVPMRKTISVFAKNPFARSTTQVSAIVFMALIYYFIIDTIKEETQLKRALMVYMISATLTSIYGSVMYALVKLKAVDIVNYFGAMAGSMPPVDLYLDRGVRIRAFFIEPLMLGTYLISAIPVTFISCFTKWFKYKKLIFLGFCLQSVVLILTISRAAWLGAFVSLLTLLVLFFWKIPKKNLIKILMLLFFAAAMFVLIKHRSIEQDIFRFKKSTLIMKAKELTIGQIETLKKFNEYVTISRGNCSGNSRNYRHMPGLEWSTMMRINDIVAGINMAKDHPWRGVGWGNYIYHYLNYDPQFAGWWWIKWPETGNRPGTPVSPNLFITVLAETGFPGLFLFIIFLFSIILACLKAIALNYRNNYGLLIGGFLAAILGVIVCYNFFSTFYFTFVWVMLGLAMTAVKLAVTKRRKNEI